MSSLEDSYNYQQYSLLQFEAGKGPPVIKKTSRLIAATVQNRVDILKELLDSPKWYRVSDAFGYSLLQIAILRRNYEVFDYLLSLNEFPFDDADKTGETALVLALSSYVIDFYMSDYFALELIEKGANIHWIGPDGSTLLHYAVDRLHFGVVTQLIRMGININVQNLDGQTAQHMCYAHSPYDASEVAAVLLCYGADASICDVQGFIPFDVAVMNKVYLLESLEPLCYYTFDKYTCHKLNHRVLFKLAVAKLPHLFHHVTSCTSKVVLGHYHDVDCIRWLFWMDIEYLEVIIRSFDYVISHTLNMFSKKECAFGLVRCFKFCSLQNLEMLLMSDVRDDVMKFVRGIKDVFKYFKDDEWWTESQMTQFICYLLSYGLKLTTSDFHTIYRKFGYCELFKILLHMKMKRPECIKGVIPSLMYNVTLEVDDCLNRPDTCMRDLYEVLDYFAYHGIQKFCGTLYDRKLIAKLSTLPDVPRLLELSRNVCRRFLIKKFNITSAAQLHGLLKRLPVSVTHEKIITYETKLY